MSDSVIQQPESQTVQSGDCATLTCSVRAAQCPPEHTSIMWLKSSDNSAPEMIYSSGYKNNSCQRTERGGMICVYNLVMWNITWDDAGTYYCAVALCGYTMFGNGTRMKIHSKKSVFVRLMCRWAVKLSFNTTCLFSSLWMRCWSCRITCCEPHFDCADTFKCYLWDGNTSTCTGTLQEPQKRSGRYVKL